MYTETITSLWGGKDRNERAGAAGTSGSSTSDETEKTTATCFQFRPGGPADSKTRPRSIYRAILFISHTLLGTGYKSARPLVGYSVAAPVLLRVLQENPQAGVDTVKIPEDAMTTLGKRVGDWEEMWQFQGHRRAPAREPFFRKTKRARSQ
ncbi:hypothetical protein BGY98DRAFT_937552 [Russula aff. rugulosa BPL654]|nr:hypothetical protein BGY98DRAFT_937552 [Russula aff. rugulosa BPL654]